MSGPGDEGEALWEGELAEPPGLGGHVRLTFNPGYEPFGTHGPGLWRRRDDGSWEQCHLTSWVAAHLARQNRELVAALRELLAAGSDYLAEPEDDARVSVVRRYNAARAAAGRLTEEG